MDGRLLNAIMMATVAHAEQKRKDGSPYVLHPLRVCTILQMFKDTCIAEVLIAAVLHDTLEDTQLAEFEIDRMFGQRVLNLVREVSDDRSKSKAGRKRAQLAHAATYTQFARWIKIADMDDNLGGRLKKPELFDPAENAGYFGWKYAIFKAMQHDHSSLHLQNHLRELFMEALEKKIFTLDNASPEGLEYYFTVICVLKAE